jgi:hypothetical protein
MELVFANIISVLESFQPISFSECFTPKKEGREIVGWFIFVF